MTIRGGLRALRRDKEAGFAAAASLREWDKRSSVLV